MPDFTRKQLPHDVPSWIDPTREAFFITINCTPRGANQLAKPEIWQAIEETIRFREDKGAWKWKLILAMPAHFHGIVTFPERAFLKKRSPIGNAGWRPGITSHGRMGFSIIVCAPWKVPWRKRITSA
jgi:hypothetical protein